MKRFDIIKWVLLLSSAFTYRKGYEMYGAGQGEACVGYSALCALLFYNPAFTAATVTAAGALHHAKRRALVNTHLARTAALGASHWGGTLFCP